MIMMSHTLSGRVGRFGSRFGFVFGFGVRYGGFGFGFGFWLWVLGFGFGFGVRYGAVGWVGVGRGGIGGAADRAPEWQIKRVQEPM